MQQSLNLIPLTPFSSHLPLLIYLPGMDGTGTLLKPQLKHLQDHFEVWGLTIPPNDRCPWLVLVQALYNLIYDLIQPLHSDRKRLLYLCGESFGGCLALQLLAQYPYLSDRLILVNPASAFQHQPLLRWSVPFVHWFAPMLYPLATIALLPFLVDSHRVSEDNRQSLLSAMQSVKPETAAWRLSLLEQFDLKTLDLYRIKQPTLIIAGEHDRLLPSVSESDRLSQKLMNSQTIVLPKSSHACLLESDINLAKILQQKQFLSAGVPVLTAIPS
jgi:pimeloyl-ACP methyl ester carboxylesterase